VVIRCERCSTLYELDEALLAPGGSQVQCTRCQHVFTAFPPRAPGRTLVGVPATTGSEAPSAPRTDAAPAAGPRQPGPVASAPHAGPPGTAAPPQPQASAPRAEPRAVRSGPPPVYRPSPAAALPTSTTGARAPLLKRDTIGTFENRLRWSARWRWLAPSLAAILVGGGVAAWFLFGRRADPEVSRTRGDAMALVALDDAGSVDQAITRLDAVLRRAPNQRGAASDRALAYVIRAAGLVEEGEGLATRAAARLAERDRLRRDQPAGWEEQERVAASEAKRLEGEVRAREERARSLGAAAAQALKHLQPEQGDAPELARALAAYYALGADREHAIAVVRAARERAPADLWLDLVEGWLDARDHDGAARRRALVQLGALSSAHPELLRARYLLATVQGRLGRRSEAIATLDALLAANGHHEGAKRLRDELVLPPPPPAPPAPAAAPAAPAPDASAKPPTHKRKRVTHTDPAVPPVVPTVAGEPGAAGAADAAAAGASPGESSAVAPTPAPPGPVAQPPPAATPAPAATPPGPTSPPPEPPRPEPRRQRDPTTTWIDEG
jgi:predicted Zn finger-like uncharacterized protein